MWWIVGVVVVAWFGFAIGLALYIEYCTPNTSEEEVDGLIQQLSRLTEPLDRIIDEHTYFVKHGKFPELAIPVTYKSKCILDEDSPRSDYAGMRKMRAKKYGVPDLSERPNYEAKIIRDTIAYCKGGVRMSSYEDPNTMTTVYRVESMDGSITEKRVSKELMLEGCWGNDDDWRDS